MTKKRTRVIGIAASLGFPGKIELEENDYEFKYQNLTYYTVEAKKFERAKVSLRGKDAILYRKGKADDALINKTFVSLGSCYSENIFDLISPLFKTSLWIRTNLGNGYKEDGVSHNIKKIRELFDLTKDSTVIVIVQDYFEFIQKALDETEERKSIIDQ